MIRTYFILLFLLFTSFAFSQEMKVKSMRYVLSDLTARTNLRTDINGDTCALVRVHLASPDAKFEGNIADSKYDSSEYLVYMSPGSKRIRIKVEGYLPLTVDFSEYNIKTVESRQTYVLVIELPAISNSNSSIMRNVKFSVSPIESKLKINNLDFVPKNGKVDVPLNEGVHTYTVSCDYYVSETKTFIVDQNHEDVSISLKPLYSTLTVTSSIPDAEVFVDNNNVGKTPLTCDIIGGTHEVKIQKEGYKTEIKQVDVKSTAPLSLNIDFSTLIDVVIEASVPNAILSFNEKVLGQGKAKVTEAAGDYQVSATAKGFYDYKGTVHIDGKQQSIKLNLKRRFFYSNGIYVEGGFQIGNLLGFGAEVGGYIHNLNVEVEYIKGVSKSEDIFWNTQNNSESKMPTSYRYNPTYIGGRFGYGVMLYNRMRLTPQIGIGVVSIQGTKLNNGDTQGIEKSYVAKAVFAARFHYAITKYLGISITPEYGIALKKGDAYNSIAQVSNTVDKWSNGFNCKLGVNVFF